MSIKEHFIHKVNQKAAPPKALGLAESYPEVLNLWSDRNDCSASSVKASSHRLIWWSCPQGHEWQARVFSVVKDGCRCPFCTGRKAVPGESDLATLRPDILAQWNREKNSLDPTQVMPSAHDLAWWICDKGHQWQARIFSRTREKSAGCPYCTGKKVLPGYNDLASRFPELAAQWHPRLNGELTPEQVSPGSNKKVWWCCPEGHVWYAVVYGRTRQKGTGCPVCAGTARSRERRGKPRPRPKSIDQERKDFYEIAEET